jgi:hypothetical protein
MDFGDYITEQMEMVHKDIHSIRYNIEAGSQGECTHCEEESKRLIDGLCAKCRDFFLLKRKAIYG